MNEGELRRAPARTADVLERLSYALARAVERQEFERAVRLRELQRRLTDLLEEAREATADLEFDRLPPSASGAEALRWQYDVRPLESPAASWPALLAAWRRDGWELLSVVHEAGAYLALLERRI